MPLEIDDRSRARPSGKISSAAYLVGLMMALCFIGLSHDATYLVSTEDLSVERGAGLDRHEKFEKDVNAAPARRKLAFVALMVVGAFCALSTQRSVLVHWGPAFWMMGACFILVIASLLWSVKFGETSRELVRIVVYIAVAASVARRFRPQEVCFILAMMGAGSVLVAFGVELFSGHFQPWRAGHRLHGSIHSNVLASHAMIVALVAFAFQRQSRQPWLLRTLFLAALAVIVLTKTRGALGTVGAGVGAIYLVGRPMRSTLLVVSLLCMLLSGMALVLAVGGPQLQARAHHLLLLGRSEGAMTLTGRLPLWETLWRESRDHRWFGFGYGAFWTIDRMEQLEDELEWYPGHAHSAYMQSMLDVGIVGVGFYLLLVITCLKRARESAAQYSDASYVFFFAFLSAGFVDGLVEVSFVYPRGLGLFVLMTMFSLILAPVVSSAAVKHVRAIREPASPGHSLAGPENRMALS